MISKIPERWRVGRNAKGDLNTMHEYMKKALIAALLFVSAAFAPYLSSVVDFPDRTSELACAAASPLFWQFWDELLSRELLQWIQTASDDSQESEWPPEFHNTLMRLFFQVFVKPTFEGSLSVMGGMQISRVDFEVRHPSYR